MTVFDASESLTPFEGAHARGEYGAVLFDGTQLRQVDPRWFDASQWGPRATPVDGSGRGGAWFIDASYGQCVLRQYLRGGLVARFSRDRHLWRGVDRVRSFAEFRLMREMLRRKLPVPQPIAASYLRKGLGYRAWIIMERLVGVRSLAELVRDREAEVPWERTGQMIARFHREGVEHADLNAHNILFDGNGKAWLIDFDRGRMRVPETGWREANLARLLRSLRKVAGKAGRARVDAGFAKLRAGYDAQWAKGQ